MIKIAGLTPCQLLTPSIGGGQAPPIGSRTARPQYCRRRAYGRGSDFLACPLHAVTLLSSDAGAVPVRRPKAFPFPTWPTSDAAPTHCSLGARFYEEWPSRPARTARCRPASLP